MPVEAIKNINTVEPTNIKKQEQNITNKQNSEEKINGKHLLLGSLATLALGGIVYFATRGRSGNKSVGTPVSGNNEKAAEILKEYTTKAFKDAGHKFEKGIAKLTNGQTYTGTITNETKDGSKIICEYKNGKIQKSTIYKDEKAKSVKTYSYDDKGNLSSVNRKESNNLFTNNIFEKKIDNEKGIIIVSDTTHNKYVKDIKSGKILQANHNTYYYRKNGTLKYKTGYNQQSTFEEYYPDGKTVKIRAKNYSEHEFYNDKGELVCNLQLDRARGGESPMISYPNGEYYSISSSYNPYSYSKHTNIDINGKGSISIIQPKSSKAGYKSTRYRIEPFDDERVIVHQSGITEFKLANGKTTAAKYNPETKEWDILNAEVDKKTVEEFADTSKDMINKVKQQYKDILKMKNELYNAQNEISKRQDKVSIQERHFSD